MNVGAVIDPKMESPTAIAVQKKYGPRATALITGAHAEAIVDKDTPDDFLEYQSKMRGFNLVAHKLDLHDLEQGTPIHQLDGTLKGKHIRPYIATPELISAAHAAETE
jgi:hypothetical protein